jgi:flavin-dependent dehydrogenase
MLAPTLSRDGAAARVWDVVVAGAGPAGALAAHELARAGLAVLLVDQAAFPRWKVCGACLNGRALSVLQAAGLEALVERRGGVPLSGFELAAGGRRAHIPLPAGIALSREALDAALIEAAVQAGAHFLPQTQAARGRASEMARSVWLRDRQGETEVTARLVLAATGLGGRPLAEPVARRATPLRRSRIGAGLVVEAAAPFYRAGTIFMACGTGGYVGLVRLEDGRLNVAAALDPDRVHRGGPGFAVPALLCEAGLPPIPDLARGSWRGTPALCRPPARPAAHRLFVLGDAAGYVEPFTGEGMAWALASAAAVVPLAARAVQHWDAALVGQWYKVYRQTVARRQVVCRTLAALLRSPGWMQQALVSCLALAPALAAPLVRRFNQPATAYSGVET